MVFPRGHSNHIRFLTENLMKANYCAVASAGVLLTSSANVGQAATTVQTTVGPQAASSNFDLLFTTPLTSVQQLVSISTGSVNTGEGATMTISGILPDNSLVQLFSKVSSPFQNVSLFTITGDVFTPFPIPQTVKGLRFTSTGPAALGTFAFPALTVLTFAVVPEPAAAIMMLLGVVFLAVRHRRKIS